MIGGTLKVEFLDQDILNVEMMSQIDIENRNNLGLILKEIGIYLNRKYHYLLDGIYDVECYQCGKYFIFEMEWESDYPTIDFNITFHPNSRMLLEFMDSEYFFRKKYYYQGNYYMELPRVLDKTYCFEFGKVIYGEAVDEVLKNGVMIS